MRSAVNPRLLVGDLGTFRAHAAMLNRPIPASVQHRDEVKLWRLYWLHEGRLYSPFVGALDEPVAPTEDAVCSYDRRPGMTLSRMLGRKAANKARLADHSPEDVPARNCDCGWRATDNVASLAHIAARMQDSALHFEPVHAYLLGPRPRWTVLPTPALVMVTGRQALPDDRLAVMQEFLSTTPGGRRVTAATLEVKPQFFNFMPEGRGQWRARTLTITGPILTGRVGYTTTQRRDVEDYYGIPHLDFAEAGFDFTEVVEQAGRRWPLA